ncbi:MAG: hypothetical protein LBV64_01855 [Mediterranea sp.]|jgi:polygalacturonase|nr:hypothetical protein [Mediterranea sp.]
MIRIKIIAFVFISAVSFSLSAQQKMYNASMFGIRSDGTTLNTRSIQKAIDYISENGGGRLMFYVGRYRTGTIWLKSNVTIELREGAALMASTSPYDYEHINGKAALIIAQDQQNISITGQGLIEGEGIIVNQHINEQTAKGNLPKGQESFRPALIYIDKCSTISIDGILLENAVGNVQEYTKSTRITLKNITVKNKQNVPSKGIVLDACSDVNVTDSFIDTSSTPLLLRGSSSKNVKVHNSITANGKKIQAQH